MSLKNEHHESRAFLFDGRGSCKPVPLEQTGAQSDTGFEWIHLVQNDPATQAWLDKADLPPVVLQAITAAETRPRCTAFDDAAVLILRGVNLNEGARPEDMISVRLWITATRVVSYSQRPLIAIQELQVSVTTPNTAKTPGHLLGRLAQRLADRAEPTVADLNDQLDSLEEAILNDDEIPDRSILGNARRSSIALRRYMMPQRDALTTLVIEDFSWLSDHDYNYLREANDRITLLSEELDAIRDRAQVLHEQIQDKRAETMNRQMFILSAVAAIFLPLGFITGLLGINVGGVPGVESPYAFAIVCVGLAALTAFLVWLFRKWGLL